MLQSGAPVADALVYPVEPNPVDGPFNMRPDQPQSATNAIDAANEDVLIRLAEGYGDTGYDVRRVVLREDIRTSAEAEALLKLARAGVPIWCSHTMPARWSALQGSGSSEVWELRTAFERAEQDGKVVDARRRGWAEIVLAERTVRWPDSAKLSFQHRRISGAEIYFVASWEEPFSGEVTFPHDAMTPDLWDADTGRMSRPSGFAVRDGRTAIPLDLGPNDSTIVVFADEEPHEVAASPRAGSAVLAAQLIFPPGRFPQSYASTIVETERGLVAAWFAGSREGLPDVGIWLSRNVDGTWTEPVEVATGTEDGDTRYSCRNPVLFQPRNGPLLLFYKVGPDPTRWWGRVMSSTDSGRT